MKYLRKSNIYSFLLLTFPLFIDCLNGIMRGASGEGESSIGILYRGIIILWALKYGQLKYPLILNLCSITAIVCCLFQWICGLFSFVIISSLIKTFYGFFVLKILLGNKNFYNENKTIEFAVWYGVGAAIVLIVSFIFGWGYASYFDGAWGTKGFFVAMNDVGLTILILNGFSCMFYLKQRRIRWFIYCMVMSCGSCLTGSMTGILGTAAIICLLGGNILFCKFQDSHSTTKEKSIVIAMFAFILFYLVGKIILIIEEDAYLLTKYSNLTDVLFNLSGRGYLIEAACHTIGQRSFLYDIFGQGNHYNILNGIFLGFDVPKAAEVDILDLLGTYGLLLTTLIIYYPLKILAISLLSYHRKRTVENFWIFIITLLFVLHSVYGGHAFTSPLSFSYYMLCVYLLVRHNQLKLKTSNSQQYFSRYIKYRLHVRNKSNKYVETNRF